MKVGIVGCGWAGAACARTLVDAGVTVDVFEAADVVGGHSRSETLHGVVYEPNGPHIFHTDDNEVAALVMRFGVRRRYEHRGLARVHPDGRDDPVLLSWPPQVDELRRLSIWPRIESELDGLPPHPSGDDLETYAVSLMGPTLYELFIRGYSTKQWGCEPRRISSSFAPRRLDLRRDANRALYPERYQFFEARGFNAAIERVAGGATVHTGVCFGLEDVVATGSTLDAWVVTAPLDQFVPGSETLAWRGIESRVHYHPTASPGDVVTPGYVVNHPDLRYPYTRTVESKHATGQQIDATVVCEEYPGAPLRHYPVPTVDGDDAARNAALMRQIRAESPVPVGFCGRLATYRYINQDEAIRQGIDCARGLLSRR